MSVQAKDRETGTEASITVTASSGLTSEELQRIIDEQRDQLLEQRQAAETRSKADELSLPGWPTWRRSSPRCVA